MGANRRVCPVCQERIGVYEPVVAVENGSARHTSLAREPVLVEREVLLMHGGCATPSDLS